MDRRSTPGVAHDAIVLAGGRGERLGGQDKALVEVGGRSLLARVLDATLGARRVVVVGPERPGVEGVDWVVEDPPGGGPSAGIVAGLAAVDRREAAPGRAGADSSPGGLPAWVVVLAVDQPGAAAVLPHVLHAAAGACPRTEVLCPRDGTGRPQWLLAAYRRESLTAACARVGTGHGVSVRRLVAGLHLTDVPGAAGSVGDVDTWADHRAWQDRLRP